MVNNFYLFNCQFTPEQSNSGASMCCLPGKEVLLRIFSEDFHKRERLMFGHPQLNLLYYHEYQDSEHDGMLLIRIANRRIKIVALNEAKRRLRPEYPYLYVFIDFNHESPVFMIEEISSVPTAADEVREVLEFSLNVCMMGTGWNMKLIPACVRKAPLSPSLQCVMDKYAMLPRTFEKLYRINSILELMAHREENEMKWNRLIAELKAGNMNEFIEKLADKMEEKMIGRMFEGATISNSVVVGVAQSGAQVYYMPNKQEENPQKTENLQGKEAIIDYLDRLKPMVKAEYKDRYDTLWEGVLELSQVKAAIYNKGKQQDTTFNRNLLAQIIHQLGVLYVPTANTVQMAMQLEPEKGADHPVRQKLGEVPEKTIKKAIDEYIKANLG